MVNDEFLKFTPSDVKSWSRQWDKTAYKRVLDIGYRHQLREGVDMPSVMRPILRQHTEAVMGKAAECEGLLGQMTALNRQMGSVKKEMSVEADDWRNLDRAYSRLEKAASRIQYDHFGLYQVLILNFKEMENAKDTQ